MTDSPDNVSTADGAKALKDLSPREITQELDRYIVGQSQAKRAVAIALRNRWRRLRVKGEMKEEITPKNIILIGPTGVGKTEIARRLAKLAGAPFYKVEASKFTEVGYVGKDVESMIRDLIEIGISMERDLEKERVQTKARESAEERLLDLLLPKNESAVPVSRQSTSIDEKQGEPMVVDPTLEPEPEVLTTDQKTREKLRQMLKDGKLDERKVDLESGAKPNGAGMGAGPIPMVEIISSGASVEDLSHNIRDMMGQMFTSKPKSRKVKVPEALEILTAEEAAKLIDMDSVTKRAIELVENNGIIFLDEIDKIAAGDESGRRSGDVSREGVQRDILPIVEGSTVSTKYGFVNTNHILFIAAGAFHVSKPSDLIPELQGRFPIRVELDSLKKEDFLKILREPKNSLIKQYQSLMNTEGVELSFTDDAIDEVAHLAAQANDQMENIGARRLHTIMERVMDELSFDASERDEKSVSVDAGYVRSHVDQILQDQNLSQYIL